MRKHIDYYYKSYDGIYENHREERLMETLNDYGYNLDSNKKRTLSLDSICSKSGPNCLNKGKMKP